MNAEKVVVITGASSGIGAALASKLGSQGLRLVLAARRQAELNQVAQPFGQDALVVVTDVRRRDEVTRLRNAAMQHFGQVDIWINNAGRGINRSVLELSDADVDEMVAVNLKSALYGMQAIIPYFKDRGEGHLINITSFLGRIPLASYRSMYSAAKAGLNSLTANLRMDLKHEYPGIHISLIIPGGVATDFGKNALGAKPGYMQTAGYQPGQSAEEVADVIAGVIENPSPEVYTNPGQAKDLVQRYFQDVGAFEASFGQRQRP